MTLENIRLEPFEIAALRHNFQRYFPSDDHLWLFGSRVQPQARGGDIDLYIETTMTEAPLILEKQNAFLYALFEEIGLQRIDIVLNLINSDTRLPIYDVARAEGIQLV